MGNPSDMYTDMENKYWPNHLYGEWVLFNRTQVYMWRELVETIARRYIGTEIVLQIL